MPTANEELQTRAITRQLYTQRFKSSEAKKVISFLNDEMYPEILEKIEKRLARISSRGFDPGPVTTRKLREMETALSEILKDGLPEAREMLTSDLTKLADKQVAWQAERINEVTLGLIDASLPTAAQLRSVVVSRPFAGRLLRQWFKDLDIALRQQTMSAVRIGIASGETTDQIVRRLKGTKKLGYRDGVLDIDRRHIESVVRTSVQHVANHSRQALFEENEDIISSVKIVATLDSRTCPQCQSYDGEVYPVLEGDRPPFHIRCRCTTVSILKSWKEMGINLREIEEGTRFARGDVTGIPGGIQNKIKGQLNGQVPESVTYGKWLQAQPAGVQNEALGVRRGKLYREGKFTVKDFVDRRGRTIPLDKLDAAEAKAVGAG